MSRFLSRRYLGMTPYVPGEQPQHTQYIKLNTNESPFPPSKHVLMALTPEEIARLNLYPDPDTRDTGAAIARRFGLEKAQVLLGNGSDELLSFAFQAFCDADTPACFPDITYGFYKVFARIFCLPSHVLPLNAAMEVDAERLAALPGTKFLANPNAPTGHALTLERVEHILRASREFVVVVDEAYVDFGAQSAVSLIKNYDNLIVVQTMSKSRNLAGARLGYALACPELISDLRQMKFSFNPYNVNRLSLLAGAASIEDEQYFNECVDAIKASRAYTQRELYLRDFEVLPSQANFLFVKPMRLSGAAYYRALKEKGILLRHFDAPRIRDYVRVTIGTRPEMEALINATDELWREL